MAFPSKHALIGHIIDYLSSQETLPQKDGIKYHPNGVRCFIQNLAWDLAGPGCLSRAFHLLGSDDLTIYPSHFFCPDHLVLRSHYAGDGIIFARQHWLSTQNGYYIAKSP